MSFTIKTAAITVAVALIGATAAKAQDVTYDPNQGAEYTKAVMTELSFEIAQPTDEMEEAYAELDERWSIKPDTRYAQHDDQDTEETEVRVASAR